MTPEAQRISIAEFCGWKIEPWSIPGYSFHRLTNPEGKIVNNHYAEPWRLPDYIDSLDAMATAEALLTAEQHRQFRHKLWYQIDGEVEDGATSGVAQERAYQSRTAAQRAEALLRAIGEWEEPAK